MANKLTKKDYFKLLRECYPTNAAHYDEVIAFIDNEVQLLNKKNAATRKPTAQQTANAKIARSIVTIVFAEPERLFTITELQKIVPELPEDMTNQRLSAIVRTLLPEKDGTGELERIVDKRKTYFRANPVYLALNEMKDSGVLDDIDEDGETVEID